MDLVVLLNVMCCTLPSSSINKEMNEHTLVSLVTSLRLLGLLFTQDCMKRSRDAGNFHVRYCVQPNRKRYLKAVTAQPSDPTGNPVSFHARVNYQTAIF